MRFVPTDSLSPAWRAVWARRLALCVAAFLSGPAFAEDAPAPMPAAPGAAMPDAAVPAALASAPAPAKGFSFGSWMVYPSLFVGGVFDDNVYKTSVARAARWGLRVAPNIELDLDEGVHKATIYGTLDALLYAGRNATLGQDASTVQARAGLAHVWSPTQDISARVAVDYTRASGPFGSALITGAQTSSATSFVGTASSLNVSGLRQFSNQTTGSLTLRKTLADFLFVSLGGGLQDLVYERAPAGASGGMSGLAGNAFLRVGTPVTPQIHAFVEGGGDFRRYYASSFYDSDAFRVIGGLSSDLIGLVKGEAFGGVQRQFSAKGVFASLTAPTAGGRLTYYPTEYLTLGASSDLSFGSAGAAGAGSTVSARNETLQTRLQADYALHDHWRASARGGYAQTWYSGSSATASTWLAGAGMSWFFRANLAVTADYQYSRVLASSAGSTSYVDNQVSLGVTYRY